jgi:hypothetical protein
MKAGNCFIHSVIAGSLVLLSTTVMPNLFRHLTCIVQTKSNEMLKSPQGLLQRTLRTFAMS